MAFRYVLQSLLRLRESLERQEEQRLYAAAALVVQLKTKLEQLGRERLNTHRVALQEIGEGTFASTLQFVAVADAAAVRTREKLHRELAEAERLRQERLVSYREARQKREILEGLRNQQKAVYDQEVVHREQERVDEAFLIRRHTTRPE